MKYRKVLSQLANDQITYQEAYKKLYQPSVPKAAHFIKIKMRIKDSGFVTAFTSILFFIPMPVIFAKGLIKIFRKQMKMDKDTYALIKDTLKGASGSYITVKNDDVNIKIKLF